MVNEAARLASLCKDLREDVLLTESVAELLPKQSLRRLGEQVLSGVAQPRQLFGVVKTVGV